MVEAGILREDEPLELVEGELVVMSPQGPAHGSTNVRLHRALSRVYEPAAHVQVQSHVEAGPHDLPEPDAAVIRGAGVS